MPTIQYLIDSVMAQISFAPLFALIITFTTAIAGVSIAVWASKKVIAAASGRDFTAELEEYGLTPEDIKEEVDWDELDDDEKRDYLEALYEEED